MQYYVLPKLLRSVVPFLVAQFVLGLLKGHKEKQAHSEMSIDAAYLFICKMNGWSLY